MGLTEAKRYVCLSVVCEHASGSVCVRACPCVKRVCARVCMRDRVFIQRVGMRVVVCACPCVCVRVTFSSREHCGGQLTLLGLDVAEREPARVSVGYHGYDVVRARQVTRGLQDRQPEHTQTHRNRTLLYGHKRD